jgi:hypothetical protein
MPVIEQEVLEQIFTFRVRVVNRTTNRIVSELRDLSEGEAYRRARGLAAKLADEFGDDQAAADREFPFVPAPDAAYHDFCVEVLEGKPGDFLQWRGAREIDKGFVTATGRCAY